MKRNIFSSGGGVGCMAATGFLPGWLTFCLVGIVVSSAGADGKLKGTVRMDGSSTVAPITMAAAELFQDEHPRVRVTVGVSGTGGGFKKFLSDRSDLRTDISDASRPIKKQEQARAKALGVSFIEIPVGIDGISVVIHPDNDFCKSLTVEELKRIWEPGSEIRNWHQIRPEYPDLPLRLYGPGTDSGTFDYFTKAIVGKERASRSDYTASESDNVLVMGVAGDRGAMGYFGFSYYVSNKDRLNVIGIDNNSGAPVTPSLATIRSGQYRPLSRPLFLYVNKESAKRPEVRAFVEFILDNGKAIVEHPRVGYVSLSDELYKEGLSRLRDGVTGSAMAAARGGHQDLSAIFSR